MHGIVGRDSSVGIVTGYRLDGPGIECRWNPSRLSLGPPVGIGSFPGLQRPGRGVDYPLPSSAEVKERVELYIYPTSRLS
jgi:hypothetical protein